MSLGDPQSFNRFTYVLNDPLNFLDPSGLCKFRFNLELDTTNPPDARYGDQALNIARNEIIRIFRQAGHDVTFDRNEIVDGEYTLFVRSGTRGGAIASGLLGSGRGTFYAGQVQSMAWKPGGTMGLTPMGIGLAIGWVSVHEAVAHNFLPLSNNYHTRGGVTRRSFSGELFCQDAADQFNIPPERNMDLQNACSPRPIPDNYAGGGGLGGGRSYFGTGGGVGPGGEDPFRSVSWLMFERWTNGGFYTEVSGYRINRRL